MCSQFYVYDHNWKCIMVSSMMPLGQAVLCKIMNMEEFHGHTSETVISMIDKFYTEHIDDMTEDGHKEVSHYRQFAKDHPNCYWKSVSSDDDANELSKSVSFKGTRPTTYHEFRNERIKSFRQRRARRNNNS